MAQRIFVNPEDRFYSLATHSYHRQSSHTPSRPHVGAASLLETVHQMAVAGHRLPGQQIELDTSFLESYQNPIY